MSDNVLCRQCDTANPSGATFCIACAAPLVAPANGATQRLTAVPARRCRSCGVASPSEALFCVGCGSSLGGAAQPVRAPALQPALAASAAGSGATMVQPTYVYVRAAGELPLVVRALWFFFVGLPLGFAWVIVAWLFNLTLIGLPLGLWMLGMMPQVMTLKQSAPAVRRSAAQGAAGMAVRVVYFVAIGWWLSLFWMLLAWGLAATVIGLPLAFLMFERTGAVLTLSDA